MSQKTWDDLQKGEIQVGTIIDALDFPEDSSVVLTAPGVKVANGARLGRQDAAWKNF